MNNNSKHLLGVTNQGKSLIEVYDIDNELSTPVIQVKCPAYNIAGLKLRSFHGEKVILTTYGVTDAAMLSCPGGDMIWKSDKTGFNPHSIELIPFEGGELIAVAASDGKKVSFFDPSDSSGTPIYEHPHADAHGVLWDPEYSCLWAWGGSFLEKLLLTRNSDASSVFCEVAEVFNSPSPHGHDLAPVYGDTSRLWLTARDGVYQFDKSTGKFLSDYPSSELVNIPHVKGIGNYPDGTTVWIYPDGTFRSWNSSKIYKGIDNLPICMCSEDSAFYKIRVWNSDYQ